MPATSRFLKAWIDRWQWPAALQERLAEFKCRSEHAMKAGMMKAWTYRRNWPAGLRQYAASLYAMKYETWENVADFIAQARESSRSSTA